MTYFISKRKFDGFSPGYRHKKAAQILLQAKEGNNTALHDYRYIESWLSLNPLDLIDFKALTDRYHLHLEKAGTSLKEHNFLYEVEKQDAPSENSFLPIAIYLDGLRSAFNVGAILRTTEAFRLGSLYFSGHTPFIDNPKVQKTSMGTYDKVPCYANASLRSLPAPIIGLETVKEAPSIHDFVFPERFTLILGNEEYGLSAESLKACDHFVQIPLHGFKNSLNVASAFAITAAEIRRQLAHEYIPLI